MATSASTDLIRLGNRSARTAPPARRPRSLLPSISAELYKVTRRPATWLLGGFFALVIVVFNDVVGSIAIRTMSATDPDLSVFRDMLRFEYFSSSALGVVASLGGPIVLILGALIAGSEYGWNTFKTVLTTGPSRLGVLGGKLVALAVLVTAFVLAGWAAAAAGSLVVSVIDGTAITAPSLGNIVGGLGAGWLIAAVWGTAGLALGLIFRSTTAPIGLGLIWGLAAETLISQFGGSISFFETINQYLVGTNATTLANAVRGTVMTTDVGVQLSTTHAVLVLASYAVVLTTIAAYLFRRRDLA
jgi:ABC-2 type transport system permease protein